jgi:NADH-quinone oxidoreductase subunit H
MLIFPGMLFLLVLSLAGQYMDRKLHARLQNRVGPPWFQPLADLIKLMGKERVVPEEADKRIFSLAPVFALAATVTAFLYIPLWGPTALFSFYGDLIVVVYLLLIPTLTFFLGGWYSRSLFATIGAVRAMTQLFAYEIPLLTAILAPALLAGTWSISGIIAFHMIHPWYWLITVPGLCVGLVTLLGKLERVPFDIPEAETEIVAGSFTEYSGKFLGFFRIAIDAEMIVSASLLAAVFLPFGYGLGPWIGFAIYLVKVAGIIAVLCLLRSVFARLRIDQMIAFCWRIVAPVAFGQILIVLVLKEVL